MQIAKIDEIKEFSKEKFFKKVPLETEKIVFNTFFFAPRQILPFHKHPQTDELFYIIEGTGEFTVGNEQIIVSKFSAVYGPSNIFHGIVNSGDSNLIMISVQGPKPVETIYAENSTVICPVCKQEVILKSDIKEGDKIVCPRCQAKLKITKSEENGKWLAIQ